MLVNTIFVKLLPGLEGLILILHVVGFFAIIIPVVHLAPISSSSFVWTEFTNFSGYSSNGVSWLIGQSASAILFIGYDGACHMGTPDRLLLCFCANNENTAEEVQNASVNVPRAMFFTIFINGALGFATYIVILYCFGNVEETLNTPYGFPFVQIFYNATQSTAGTTVMISILIVMYISATFGFVASASRQAWAFARDNGLPFSDLWKRVSLPFCLSAHLC